MKETADNFELLPPPSPDALIPDSPVETWMIVAAVLVVVALLALVVFRKKKSPAAIQREARHAAHAEAVAALAAISPTGTRDAAIQCSLILRKYLVVAANDPALFETHEETLSRHEAFNSFSEESRLAATNGFTRLAALKYAPAVEEVPVADVISESRALLETLHHGFQA